MAPECPFVDLADCLPDRRFAPKVGMVSFRGSAFRAASKPPPKIEGDALLNARSPPCPLAAPGYTALISERRKIWLKSFNPSVYRIQSSFRLPAY